MKITDLGTYYYWADKRIIEMLEDISDEQFNLKLENTELSIRDLSIHLVYYYELWLQHMASDEWPQTNKLIAEIKSENRKGLLERWKKSVIDYALKLKECKGAIDIPISKERIVEMDFDDVIFSYTDHSTYHRGQLITTYKIVTGKNAINTDYWTYLEEVKYSKTS